MVQPKDRAKFLASFGTSTTLPTIVDSSAIARIVASEDLSFEDVKILMRGVRYNRGNDERFEYANTLLPEASDYLSPYTLAALVRTDITVEEATEYLDLNKVFFRRLVNLLPSVIRYFGKEARLRNPDGIVSMIDDCHNDFHATGVASRRDRQIREAKEKLTLAIRLARDTASTLEDAKKHFEHEFRRYRDAFYKPVPRPKQSLDDLVEELRMCSGILEIVHATADIKPKQLFLFGNDRRTSVVEWAYHMCTMWDGPKLVTTPGSEFGALCGLLFAAVSGNAEQGLAGAINRYARSDARKEWDREGEEDDPDDNFHSEKTKMSFSAKEIELCKGVLQASGLSDIARALLHARIEQEEQNYEKARTTYGPKQVYFSQMNADQIQDKLLEAVDGLGPQHINKLDNLIAAGKSFAALDIAHGQLIRASREGGIDVKSRNGGS